MIRGAIAAAGWLILWAGVWGVSPVETPAVQDTLPPPAVTSVAGALHRITAYCACSRCTGRWAEFGLTASGWEPHQGTTVAADRREWPMGACVDIKGLGRRVVQDTGSAIKGKRLDVFYYAHYDAVKFGVRYMEVRACR